MRRIGAFFLLAACSSTGVDPQTSPTPAPSGTPGIVEPIPGGDAPLKLVVPADNSVDEEKPLAIAVHVESGSEHARIFAENLPPGATFDGATISFTPDFLQGGHSWKTKLTVVDGATRVSADVVITANDTIRPPAPVITKTETMDGYARLTVTQTTDAYLDSPANAGRTFTAVVIAPIATNTPLPVRVGLHGFDGTPDTSGWSGEFRIFPSDPSNTYWWGYQAKAGDPIADYTVRRVLHLLGWVLEKVPRRGSGALVPRRRLHGRRWRDDDRSPPRASLLSRARELRPSDPSESPTFAHRAAEGPSGAIRRRRGTRWTSRALSRAPQKRVINSSPSTTRRTIRPSTSAR